MKRNVIVFLAVLIVAPILNGKLFGQTRGVSVDQTLVQLAKVTNPRMVQFFTDDFLIPEENIKYMTIYDLTGDGFGEGDIARTHPGGKFYLITPSDKAQKILNSWSFGGNVKFTAHSKDSPDQFENAPDSVRAMGGIFAALLRGLRRNYKGMPVKMHLEQNGGITSFEVWGYDPALMQYEPPPENKVPEEVPVMKLIYLEKTIVDSVYTGSR